MRVDFSLDDRYQLVTGATWLGGLHAIARLSLDQQRDDRRRGLNTAGYISGYRGSPLGGLDQELDRIHDKLVAHHITFNPAVNEDMAATAIWGTQQTTLLPGAQVDGVHALWYGKSPGLDRSMDAIRHANMAGTHPLGGVLALVGDDPACKSSTLPSNSFGQLRDLGIPVLDPADVEDISTFGLYGWQLSRYTGCWVGLIAPTPVVDSSAIVNLPDVSRSYETPPVSFDPHIRLDDSPLPKEERLVQRLELVHSFTDRNPVDSWCGCSEMSDLSIVASGQTYVRLQEALDLIGLGAPDRLEKEHIRLVKLALVWPLSAAQLEPLLGDTQAVLVVENKGDFLESEIKARLFGHTRAEVFGKQHVQVRTKLPYYGELSVAGIAQLLIEVLEARNIRLPVTRFRERLAQLSARNPTSLKSVKESRKPLFCPGCPHARSTKVPEGSIAYAGIGCHYMAQWMGRDTHTFTHMGGEGITWVGQAPFTDRKHVFVNLGDGTYFHSGLLAIRAAVAAGVNVTYKVLFNDAVAMTGGQTVEGQLSVADVVQQVTAEKVTSVRVVAAEPEQHRNAPYEVSPREEFDAVQRELAHQKGCTVLIFDQTCTNELRRKRKRGLVPQAKRRVVINADVCEGCGDCTAVSACAAIEPLRTSLGEKRRINQTRCNQDLSCMEGFCPAFVEVEGEPAQSAPKPLAWTGLPELDVPQAANILVAGVGGTGIVTVSQLLAVAAHLENKHVATLDMTGLAQKGGAVFAHVRISSERVWRTAIAMGETDVLLGADLVTANAKETHELLDAERTCGVVNTYVQPTAAFVVDGKTDLGTSAHLGSLGTSLKQVAAVDAERHSIELTGSAMSANVFLLGFAYQHGWLPLRAASIERAISINGVAVEANLTAFRGGRLAQTEEYDTPNGTSSDFQLESAPLAKLLATWRSHLTGYQDAELGAKLQAFAEGLKALEQRCSSHSVALTCATVENYARFLAPKDEYEVARLLSSETFRHSLNDSFTGIQKIRFALSPSWWPKASRTRKVMFNSRFVPLFRLLAKLKFLRGRRWLDPFRNSSERRFDRFLLQRFEEDQAFIETNLRTDNVAAAIRIQDLYRRVVGYGHIRERKWHEVVGEIDVLLHSRFGREKAPEQQLVDVVTQV